MRFFDPLSQVLEYSLVIGCKVLTTIIRAAGTRLALLVSGRSAADNMNPNQNRAATIEVGAADFEAEVLRSNQPVLVAFWAPWSRPCRILDAALEEVATARAGSVKVVKVNADDHPDLSLWYEIQSIPTLLYFVSGIARAKVVGTASKEAILSKLEMVLRGGDSTSLTPDPNKESEHHNQ